MPNNSRTLLSIVLFVFISFGVDYFAERSLAQSTNNPPVAVPDTISVHASTVTPVGANALTNDYDPDGDQLTVTYTQPTYTPLGSGNVGWNGTISASSGGTPGTFTIPYTVTDNRGGYADSTVTIHVYNSHPLR